MSPEFNSSRSFANLDSSSDCSSYLPTPATHRTCMSAAVKRYRYLRKLFNFNQMDFEFAFWQMIYLFTNPQKVYRNFQYRKETKSQFARDDPAFLVLLAACHFVSSIGFTLILNSGFTTFLKLMLYSVFVDCIASGMICATLIWFVINKFLIKPVYAGQDVEWGYTFDVHLNAFCPLIIISHIVVLFLYHVFIRGDAFLSVLFGNTIWLIAIGYYIYITFLGYRHLQILQHTELFFMTPMLILFLFFLITIIIRWNLSEALVEFYRYRIL